MNTACIKLFSAASASTSASVNVAGMRDISIIVDWARTASGSAAVVFYGTIDSGTTKYLLGIKPMLTGTVDGDGSISYTASETTGYEVVGQHEQLYLTVTHGGSGGSASVWVIGKGA